jgi:putative DNA primase/helicase
MSGAQKASAHPPNWSVILDSPGPGKAPYATLTNAVRVIEQDPAWSADKLYYDDFAGRIVYVNSMPREWRDDDDVALTVHMQDTTGMVRLAKHLVSDAVDLVARRRARHAARDYLKITTWDGIEHIAHAFEDFWGATSQDSLYVRAASANFFISIVARVLCPGCKVDTMPVFEGQQGIFKSSALQIVGGPWYAAIDEAAGSKDFLQALRGKWVVELCELNSLSKSESSHVKGMLSRQIDTYRASYGRRTTDIPRQCVFAGTTNTDNWLADDTGGRRFWPIVCGDIDLKGLAAARDQLFAEAVVAFHAGVSWWQMPDSAAVEQSNRQHFDEWTHLVLPWARLQILQGSASITIKDVMTSAIGLTADKMLKSHEMRIASILKLAKWKRHPPTKVWYPPDELEASK